MALLQTILRKNSLLFIAFWLLLAVLYVPAHHAGLFTDIKDTLYLYQHQSFLDFINRDGLGIKSLYQVTQLILYSVISLFGTHTLPWYLLFISLHAVCGVVICRFFTRIFTRFSLQYPLLVSATGTLFFLVSPVQSEVLVWKACLHYFLAVLQIFAILHWTLSYLETSKGRYLLQIASLYALSTFTIELFYLTPFFTALTLAALRMAAVVNRQEFTKSLIRIVVPLLVLLAMHMLLYHAVFGKWIPHYDIKVESAFNYAENIGKINKYLFHIYLMEYFLPGTSRQEIYEFSSSGIGIIITSVILAALLFLTTRYRRLPAYTQSGILLFFMAILSFALVVPLWFNDALLMYNDRYYYLPSVFLFMLLSVLIFRLNNAALRYAVAGAYAVACIAGTVYIATVAREATHVYYSLINQYKWRSASRVLLLNLPNNYRGIRQIPALSSGNFNRHLAVFTADSSRGEIYDVSSYNMQHAWDGAHVQVMDSMTLKVTLNQWGSWWWYSSVGAVSYENELYKVNMTDQGHEYLLSLKSKPEDLVVLFQQGEHWKEVNWNNTTGEQW